MVKEIDYCRLAPTWLQRNGESQLFKTQEAVDAAWEDGWHGPEGEGVKKGKTEGGGTLTTEKIISKRLFTTKTEMASAVVADKRYSGLKLDIQNMTKAVMVLKILEFEAANGIGD